MVIIEDLRCHYKNTLKHHRSLRWWLSLRKIANDLQIDLRKYEKELTNEEEAKAIIEDLYAAITNTFLVIR